MIKRLLKRLYLRFNPPKKNDIFWADSFDLMAGRLTELVLHGLMNKNGEAVWEPIYGKDTCRMKIVSDSMPYYVIQCEILAFRRDWDKKDWFFRSQPRRIDKDTFVKMVANGSVRNYDQD